MLVLWRISGCWIGLDPEASSPVESFEVQDTGTGTKDLGELDGVYTLEARTIGAAVDNYNWDDVVVTVTLEQRE